MPKEKLDELAEELEIDEKDRTDKNEKPSKMTDDEEDESKLEEQLVKVETPAMNVTGSAIKSLVESLGIESEDSVTALTEAFEAAVEVRVDEAREEIKEEAIEAVKVIKERNEAELTEHMNAYATMIVNEWVEKNEMAIMSEVELDRARNVVEGVTAVLEANGLTVSVEEGSEIAAMEEATEALRAELAEANALKDEYRSVLEEGARDIEISKYSLTESQRKRVARIVESFAVDKALAGRIKSVVELISESASLVESTITAPQKQKPITDSLEESFVKPMISEDVADYKPTSMGSFIASITK